MSSTNIPPAADDPVATLPTKKPVSRLKRGAIRLIRLIVICYAAMCVTLYFYQDHMIYPRDLAPTPTPMLYNNHTVELIRDVPNVGKVVAWFIPSPTRKAKEKAPLVIYFHGNAEIIDYQDVPISGYGILGCHILLPEYRGYGRSAGIPSEASLVDDAVFFYDEIIKRPDVDTSRIIIHGRSLGGGVAAQLAARRKPNALVLESTFSSLADMAAKYYAPSFLVKDKFHTDDVVRSLDVPLLLFHGDCDNIIPVSHAHKLRNLAHDVTYMEYGCQHNDFPGDGNDTAYWTLVEQFLKKQGVITAKNQLYPSTP